MHKK
jgi:ubiquitin carboxyl-terminal hydrolase 5/13